MIYAWKDDLVTESNSKEAINLSKEMMNGNKWAMFKVDLSFLPYNILNLFTFGLLGIFFINPYMKGTETEIYYNLRNKYLKENKYSNYFNDNNLNIAEIKDYYPGTKKEEIKLDYYRKYSLTSFILFFFSISQACSQRNNAFSLEASKPCKDT